MTMPNNQTIDGVPRELLERAIAATMTARGPGSPTERDLRALLNAPAPEPVPTAWMRFDHDQKAVFTLSKRSNDSEPLYPRPTAYRMPKPATQPQGEGEPVAEIVSKYGDPESFGERELITLKDISKFPYGTKLYAEQPAPVAADEREMEAV